MTLEEYSTFRKASELKPHHQMQLRVISKTLVGWGSLIPLQSAVFYSPSQLVISVNFRESTKEQVIERRQRRNDYKKEESLRHKKVSFFVMHYWTLLGFNLFVSCTMFSFGLFTRVYMSPAFALCYGTYLHGNRLFLLNICWLYLTLGEITSKLLDIPNHYITPIFCIFVLLL